MTQICLSSRKYLKIASLILALRQNQKVFNEAVMKFVLKFLKKIKFLHLFCEIFFNFTKYHNKFELQNHLDKCQLHYYFKLFSIKYFKGNYAIL